MRYGLVGTGYWAAEVHAAALADAHDVEFVGVWGRDPAKAAALAETRDVRAYDDVDALFTDVEAVAFAVPPDVQAELAVRAARAGCHLLLEKPVALDAAAADATARAGVASIVFLTSRFVPGIARWLEDTAEHDGWLGGHATLLAALDTPGNPFGASPWRREHGALWDVGPHMLSLLLPVLGPVEDVRAAAGPRDTVHVALRHRDGASSEMTLSLTMPEAAATQRVAFYGEPGWRELPAGFRSTRPTRSARRSRPWTRQPSPANPMPATCAPRSSPCSIGPGPTSREKGAVPRPRPGPLATSAAPLPSHPRCRAEETRR